jgi:hypothetical protein
LLLHIDCFFIPPTSLGWAHFADGRRGRLFTTIFEQSDLAFLEVSGSDSVEPVSGSPFGSFVHTIDVVLFFMRLMTSNLLYDDVLLNTIAIHQIRFLLKCIGLSITPLSPPLILGLATRLLPISLARMHHHPRSKGRLRLLVLRSQGIW